MTTQGEGEVTGFVDGREVWLTRTSNGYTKTYLPQEAVAAALKAIEEAVDRIDEGLLEDGYNLQCSSKHPCAVCKAGTVIAEKRRQLGLEVKS